MPKRDGREKKRSFYNGFQEVKLKNDCKIIQELNQETKTS